MIDTATLTGREVRALIALADMRGLQLDLLADFLTLGRSQTYDLVAKLLDARLVHPLTQVQAGPKWVVPTPAAASWALGWRTGDWRPSPMWAAQCRAVAHTRVALAACAPEDWISERVMRHESPGRGRYPYDGRLMRPDWQCAAVKVDTSRYVTREDFSRRMYAVMDQAHRDQCTEVLHVCAGYVRADTAVGLVRRILPYAPDLDVRVTDLDALIAEHRTRADTGAGRIYPIRHHATGR